MERTKKAIFTEDVEEVINQNYQFSEVTAISSQKGNVLPLRIYYQTVALTLLLTVPFHIIIIIIPSFCLYDFLILVSF